MEVQDKLGQPITVGSYIAYGHALDRSAGLRVGKVLDIYEREESWGSKTTYTFIKVWGVDDDWKRLELCKTAGHLQFPSRIVVLNPETVPQKFKDLLEPITADYKYKRRAR